MTCHQWQRQLIPYLSGGLTGPEKAGFEGHVRSCPDCAQQLAWEKAIQSELHDFPEIKAPEGFNQAVWRGIDAAESVQTGWLRKFRWTPAAVAAVAMAGIALAVVSFRVVPLPGLSRPEKRQISSHVQAGTGPHEEKIGMAVPETGQQESVRNTPGTAARHIERPQPSAEGPAMAPEFPQAAALAPEASEESHPGGTQPELHFPTPAGQQHAGTAAGGPAVPDRRDHRRSIASENGTALADAQPQEPVMHDLQVFNNKLQPNRGEQTRVTFVLARPASMNVRIFTKEGRLVKTMLDGSLEAGVQQLAWDGTDQQGRTVASGVYLIVLAGDVETTRLKVLVVK